MTLSILPAGCEHSVLGSVDLTAVLSILSARQVLIKQAHMSSNVHPQRTKRSKHLFRQKIWCVIIKRVQGYVLCTWHTVQGWNPASFSLIHILYRSQSSQNRIVWRTKLKNLKQSLSSFLALVLIVPNVSSHNPAVNEQVLIRNPNRIS